MVGQAPPYHFHGITTRRGKEFYTETIYTKLGGEAQDICRKKITIILTTTVSAKDPIVQDSSSDE